MITSSLTVISAVALTLYFSTAWNATPFPIAFFRLLAKLPGFKSLTPLGEGNSRSVFEVACLVRWPFPKNKIGHWMNCPICNSWFFALLATAITIPVTHTFAAEAFACIVVAMSVVSALAVRALPITAVAHPATGPERVAPPVNPKALDAARSLLEFNSSMGFIQEKQPDGSIVIKPDPNKQTFLAEVGKFFSDAPCWFDGCLKLREDYAIAKASPPPSSGCQKCDPMAAVNRDFMLRVKRALEDQDAKILTQGVIAK